MKRLHNMAAFGLAAVLTASVPFQALAGSPEFAYTPEKWSALRDNKLEYLSLIHISWNPIFPVSMDFLNTVCGC